MSDLPKTIWADPFNSKDWTEGGEFTTEFMVKQHPNHRVEFTRTDTVEGMKSTLSTAMKLLRDNQSVMHFSRELNQADHDVLRQARKWK